MAQPPIIETLRAQTGAAHQALEEGIDLERRLDHRDDRVAVVRGFHQLHAAAEAMLAPWLSPVTGLDFAGRRRAQTVRNALTALGATPGSQAATPVIANVVATSARLEGVRGDDWIFGVSATGADGSVSPVASAVPAGAFEPVAAPKGDSTR